MLGHVQIREMAAKAYAQEARVEEMARDGKPGLAGEKRKLRILRTNLKTLQDLQPWAWDKKKGSPPPASGSILPVQSKRQAAPPPHFSPGQQENRHYARRRKTEDQVKSIN